MFRAVLSRKISEHTLLTHTRSQSTSSKIYQSAASAIDVVKSGDVLLGSGFGLCGLPNTLYQALAEKKDSIKSLTGVSNNAGAGGRTVGMGLLVQNGQVGKLIASYLGT